MDPILQGIEEIKSILARIVSIDSGDWIKGNEIPKYIKHPPSHNPGGLSLHAFEFTNYWKKCMSTTIEKGYHRTQRRTDQTKHQS